MLTADAAMVRRSPGSAVRRRIPDENAGGTCEALVAITAAVQIDTLIGYGPSVDGTPPDRTWLLCPVAAGSMLDDQDRCVVLASGSESWASGQRK
jgi:hypothetical protein